MIGRAEHEALLLALVGGEQILHFKEESLRLFAKMVPDSQRQTNPQISR